ATLIHADVDEIAFVKNTTQGILIAANGIDWHSGDNCIITDMEFPANVYPWMALSRIGVETRFVKARNGRILVDDIEAAMDARTRVVSISWVEFSNGFRNDIERIGEVCYERGVLFVLDAIQGLGALDIDVKRARVDVLTADAHKWLLGPEGIGCFYCSRNALEQLITTNIGWKSVVGYNDYFTYDLTLLPNAQRFEEGSLNTVGIHGLNAAVSMLLEIGIPEIERRVLHLTNILIDGLIRKGYQITSSLESHERSAIVAFTSSKWSPQYLVSLLREHRIIACVRGNAVRLSPHFYNSEEEMDRVIDVLP
ncbi:MAG TPA: aminotransferase class V-fold PLP-dependent enzyme, partial [Armatimonadetes bacterium]|nr:aminotransferase class V-fold PLP-dependent enzyme [Armatimonadota bacterium]